MKVIIDNVFFILVKSKILYFLCMAWNHNYNPLENQLDFFSVKLLLDRHRKFFHRIRISPQNWPQMTFHGFTNTTESSWGPTMVPWDRPGGPESDPDIRRSLYRWCHYTCDNWSQDFINVHIVLWWVVRVDLRFLFFYTPACWIFNLEL